MLTGPHIARALREHRPLSRDQELQLALRAKDGDKAAAEELVLCNLGFVIQIAQEYAGSEMPHDDLLHCGVLGLLRAVAKFDPARGFRLCTYSAAWIRAELDAGAGISWPIVRKQSHQARKMARGGVRVPIDSLNAPVGDDDDAHKIDCLRASDPQPDEQYFSSRSKAEVRWRLAILHLTAIEREIVADRLMAPESATLTVIAARHGCSREWIRLVEKKLLPKLRRHFADLQDLAA